MDAVVSGDHSTLKRLLEEDPQLVRLRSARPHAATLLHYVAANGVEDDRQKTPPNIVQIAAMLLHAGADVDAPANLYYGKSTTLDLVATSVHPERAGLLEPLIEKLLAFGAKFDHLLIDACLANFRLHAAEYLAAKITHLSFEASAGLGRLDELQRQMTNGFLLACEYGRNSVVEFLLQAGVDIAAQNRQEQTGLHLAVIGAQIETVKLLMSHNAPLRVMNMYGGTPLGQAIWCQENGGNPDVYAAIRTHLETAR